MTFFPSGGTTATLALIYVLLGWFVGTLYGAYLWERAHRDRPLSVIAGLREPTVATDGGSDGGER